MSFSWEFVYNTLESWYNTLLKIFDFMDMPIKELNEAYLVDILGFDRLIAQFVSAPFNTATTVLGIGDMSIIMFLVGNALLIYLLYQFVIWVLNLVT